MKKTEKQPLPDHEKDDTPTLVFIHGLWHAAWCWVFFVKFFRRAGFRVLPINLRKHGDRGKARKRRLWGCSLEKYVDDVEASVADIKGPIVLVGHSAGAFLIEAAMARIRPVAVVLLAPVRHSIVRRASIRFALSHPILFLWQLLGLTLWPTVRRSWNAYEMFFSPTLDLAQEYGYWRQLQNESWWVAIQFLTGLGPKPANPTGIPTLVIGGGRDRWVLLGDLTPIELIPSVPFLNGLIDRFLVKDDLNEVAAFHHTTAHVFPAMPHDLMLDNGQEAVSAQILQWLENNGIEPSPTPIPNEEELEYQVWTIEDTDGPAWNLIIAFVVAVAVAAVAFMRCDGEGSRASTPEPTAQTLPGTMSTKRPSTPFAWTNDGQMRSDGSGSE